VSNAGPGNATGVVLTDNLPGGNAATPVTWSVASATPNGSFAVNGAAGSQTLSLTSSTLASGASETVHVTAPTSSTSCTTYNNTASVSATNEPSTVLTDNSVGPVAIVVQCPAIHVTKTADATPVSAGTALGYTVTVSNAGPGNATGVVLTDNLP